MINIDDYIKILNHTSNEEMIDKFKKLSNHDLEFLALMENLPEAIIPFLYQHPKAAIRQSIANNSSIPLDILSILARDSSDIVRHAVSENPKINEEIMSFLFLDDSCRDHLALNKAITPNIIDKLLNTKNENHLLKLLQNDKINEEVLYKIFSLNDVLNNNQLYYGIINHPNSPHQLVQKIFDLNENNLKESIASSNNINKKMYLLLINEKKDKINCLMINNKRCPSWVLFHLYNDYKEKVSQHHNWKGIASELLKNISDLN